MFFNDPVVDYVFKIVLGFFVGALIGLERERTRIVLAEKRSESREYYKSLPGIRSFGLLSLYGMLMAYMPSIIKDPALSVAFFLFSAGLIFVVYLIYVYKRAMTSMRSGITTYIVMALSIFLGYLVGVDRVIEAVATSSLITLVLAIKPSIQRFVRGVKYNELLSGLELALFVFVLGPFFMTHPTIYGIDLSKLYILFVIILGLSYFSYIAVKVKGTEALKYVAFLGGLVNSEAAASNIADVLSKQPRLSYKEIFRLMMNYLFIIIAAMIIRNMIVVGILAYPSIEPVYLAKLLGYVTILLLTPLIFTIKTLIFEKEPWVGKIEVTIENPLTYSVAIKVVLAYTTIFILGYAMSTFLPPEWLLIIALIGGFVNAGATILTFLTLSAVVSLGIKYISSLVVIALTGGIVNKVFFVKTTTNNKAVLKATALAVAITMVASIVSIILIYITG